MQACDHNCKQKCVHACAFMLRQKHKTLEKMSDLYVYSLCEVRHADEQCVRQESPCLSLAEVSHVEELCVRQAFTSSALPHIPHACFG